MGYKLAFVEDRNGLIVMTVVFTLTSILATALRFRARKLKGLNYQIDDWLALTALILVLALNGIFLGGCVERVITGHSPVVDDWPISTELEHKAEKYKYAFQVIEKIAFGVIKSSIIMLWHRIFGHVQKFRIACWIMLSIVCAWSMSFFLATLFQCAENGDWSLNWAPIGDFLTKCSDTLDMLTVFAVTDIVTDFVIMAMPVPMIWSLQMPIRRKIAITAVFLVGFFVVGAGIARTFVYLTTSYQKAVNPDFIQDFTIFILWSEIEINVAMLSACLPTFLPVLARIPSTFRSIRSSTLSRKLLSSVGSISQRAIPKQSTQTTHSSASESALPFGSDKTNDGSYVHTDIYTNPRDTDIELQRQDTEGIRVHNEIMYRNSRYDQ